jgi:predicted acetyltransferase
VKVGGIASVGVAPEARGMRVATRLLEHLHSVSSARGDAVTLLHAFRYGYYTRLGYAPVRPKRRFVVTPKSFPVSAGSVEFRRAGEGRAAILAAYDRSAARATGWLSRPARLWDRFFSDPRRTFLVAERAGLVVGYVAWSITQSEPHADVDMHVHEIIADDAEVKQAIFAVIGAQRDQVKRVHIELDERDAFDHVLMARDADVDRAGTEDVEHAVGIVVGGPMIRIHAVEQALTARGYASDGVLDITVRGQRSRRLTVKEGVATVREGSPHGTSVLLEAETLAAILYGGLAPSEAKRIGWLVAEPLLVRAADELLTIPPFFSIDSF